MDIAQIDLVHRRVGVSNARIVLQLLHEPPFEQCSSCPLKVLHSALCCAALRAVREVSVCVWVSVCVSE